MAIDQFLKLGDIKGESRDETHKEWIDVLAWSWGASQNGTTHLGGGGGAGKVSVQDISFTHYIDAASTNILEKCFTGKHFTKAELVVRKAGGKALDYYRINMENVIVTSVSTGGSGGEDRLTENVTLNFEEVKVTYKEQTPDGGAKGDKVFAYNMAENKPK